LDDDSGAGDPSPALAADVNTNPFLLDRLRACLSSYGRAPTFVAVDFYDRSDVMLATQIMNGLVPSP
jgi:hypothetical protein